MSLPDRRMILFAPLAFAACGFQPVYGPGGAGAALQNRVQVDPPGDQDTYILVRELESRLGRSDDPLYGLSLGISTAQAQLAVDREGDIGRFNRVATVDYSLRSLADGQVLTSGRVNNFVGYSATGTSVVSLAGSRDAQRRLMTIIADQVVSRLYAADLGG